MSDRAVAPIHVALPEGPAGVTWRRITAADRPALQALAAAIGQHDDPGDPPARPELEQQLSAVDPGALTAVAAVGGRLVAYGIVFPAGAVRLPVARFGFRPERTFLHLRRPAWPVARSPLPAGLRLVPFDAAYDEPLRRAKNRAFEDRWRSRPENAEAWARHQLGPWLRRDLSRLALGEDGSIESPTSADRLYASIGFERVSTALIHGLAP